MMEICSFGKSEVVWVTRIVVKHDDVLILTYELKGTRCLMTLRFTVIIEIILNTCFFALIDIPESTIIHKRRIVSFPKVF